MRKKLCSRTCKRKNPKDKNTRERETKEMEKRENIRDQVFIGIPTPRVFPLTRVIVARREERERGGGERERRAINENPHRKLHIPRDAYRYIFVFLMGNVWRVGRLLQYFYIFWKYIDISR